MPVAAEQLARRRSGPDFEELGPRCAGLSPVRASVIDGLVGRRVRHGDESAGCVPACRSTSARASPEHAFVLLKLEVEPTDRHHMADDEARIVSVIGGARRTSRWRVAEDTSVLTLFGRCLLDLREAETEADELWFSVASVFATVEIIVPEGTIVQPSGMAFLGASSCEVPRSKRRGPLPAVEIDSITVFGSLRIHVGQRPPRVGLLRRLFRRGPKESTIVAPAPVDDIEDDPDDWDLGSDASSLVDELTMPEPPPAELEDRTDMSELDDVLSDVLGDGDLLSADTEAAATNATPAPDALTDVRPDADGGVPVTDGAVEATPQT